MNFGRMGAVGALLALATALGGCGYVPARESDLVAMEHPSNEWMNRCYNPSYAVCGYDSLRNRQNGGSQAPDR